MPNLNRTLVSRPCGTAFLLALCLSAALLELVQAATKPDSIICISAVAVFLALRLGAVWQAALVTVFTGLMDALTIQPMLGQVLLLFEVMIFGLLRRFHPNAWSLRSTDALFWFLVVVPLLLLNRGGDDEQHMIRILGGAAEYLLFNQICVAISAVAAAAVPASFVRRRITRRPLIATHEYLASWITALFLLPACLVLAYVRVELAETHQLVVEHVREAHAASATLLLGPIQEALAERLAAHANGPDRPATSTVWVDRPVEPFSRVSVGLAAAPPGPATGAWVELPLERWPGFVVRGDVPLDALVSRVLEHSRPMPLHIVQRGPRPACSETPNRRRCGAWTSSAKQTNWVQPLASQVHLWVEPDLGARPITRPTTIDLATMLLMIPWMASVLPGYFASRRVTGPMSRAFRALSRATGAPTIPLDNPSLLMLAPRVIARHVACVSWMLQRERARTSVLLKEQDALLNASPVVLILLDVLPSSDWRVRHVSESMTRLFGWTQQEVREPGWWDRTVAPEDARAVPAVFEKVRRGNRAQREFRLTTKDGCLRFVYTELSLLDTLPDGTVRMIVVWVDITDYKNARKQAEDSNRLASLGTLAAGVAHELKQPLNVISMAAGNAMRRLEKGGLPGNETYLSAKLQRILEQVNFASRTIEDLRRTAPVASGEGVLVDVNAVARQVANVARGELSLAGIELIVNVREPLATVRALPHQLQQVVTNLVINGRDAILADRRCREEAKSDRVIITVQRTQPGRLAISVEDSGTGVPQELVSRIFEPFYTSKEDARSMGLGLFIVKNLVSSLGGIVTAQNGDLGARFVVELPATSPRNSRVAV